jgi:hypothetical protein
MAPLLPFICQHLVMAVMPTAICNSYLAAFIQHNSVFLSKGIPSYKGWRFVLRIKTFGMMFTGERIWFCCPTFPTGFLKRTNLYSYKWNASLPQALCSVQAVWTYIRMLWLQLTLHWSSIRKISTTHIKNVLVMMVERLQTWSLLDCSVSELVGSYPDQGVDVCSSFSVSCPVICTDCVQDS